MTDNAPRQPKGVPVGGQFAATAHSEPDISLSADNESRPTGLPQRPVRPAGLPPLPPRAGGSGGSGALPPAGGSGGASGSEDGDEEKRRKSQEKVIAAAGQLKIALVLANAKTLSFAARDNGTLHVNDVTNENGYSVVDKDDDKNLADGLTSAINSQVPGGGGIPATHFLGDRTSALVDVSALVNENRIKFVRPTGLPPLR